MDLISIIHLISPMIGLATIIIGILAIINPKKMSKNFGIDTNDIKTLPYVSSLGVRDIFMGITILILYHNQLWNILGLINLLIGLVAVSDFLFVLKNGDKRISLIHLTGAIIMILCGYILL